jgi:ATP-dependent Clp protease ATP-binding subunit ClpX
MLRNEESPRKPNLRRRFDVGQEVQIRRVGSLPDHAEFWEVFICLECRAQDGVADLDPTVVRVYLTVRIILTRGTNMGQLVERLAESLKPEAYSLPSGPYYCSFCLKADFEVKKLCAGYGRIFICDECVATCTDYMTDRTPDRPQRQPLGQQPTERLLALLAPIEETAQGKSNQLQLVVETLRSRQVSWARIGDGLGISRQSAWERFS